MGDDLDPRAVEARVARLAALGYSAAEIGATLGLAATDVAAVFAAAVPRGSGAADRAAREDRGDFRDDGGARPGSEASGAPETSDERIFGASGGRDRAAPAAGASAQTANEPSRPEA